MERRQLGRTGLHLSLLGFGCGNVGGLMVRGTPAERERAVARALELGVNYFDTAPSYGDLLSERHLGQALRALRVTPHVGTKVRLDAGDLDDVAGAVTRSLEASLGRLGLERVDVLHFHNPLAAARHGHVASTRDVLEAVLPAFDRLRRQGKVGFVGITAIGETEALHQVIASGAVDSAQVFYNLLNPSAGGPEGPGGDGQDFRGLLPLARRHGVGTMVVRALAAGALGGADGRHAIAQPEVAPIASGPTYDADVRRAQVFRRLVTDGLAHSLAEAAYRFVIAHEAVTTVLVGSSSLDHLEQAAEAIVRGPLPAPALARIAAIHRAG